MLDALAVLEQLAAHGTPSPGVASRIDVGTRQYLEYFKADVMDDLVERGGSTCRVYEGQYGDGKTHLLQLLEDTVLERGGAVVRADLSSDLHLSDWRGLMQHALQELTIRDGRGVVHRGLPALLTDIAWDPAGDEALRSMRVAHTGFREAVRLLMYGDASPAAKVVLRRFLLGEQVTVSELKRVGIRGVKGSVTARNAERTLQTLSQCLRAIGVPAMAILFDETERILGYHGRLKDTRAANLMRRLIDGTTGARLESFFVGFAVLPGTIEQAASVYPALGQRLRVIERSEGGFRRPVLTIGTVNECRTPEAFLDNAVSTITGLAQDAGHDRPGLQTQLHKEGRQVIESHASGYRRPLFKALASAVLFDG